jgi:hypothetical protein
VDLLGELAENVWDVILPEPFSQLHQMHVAVSHIQFNHLVHTGIYMYGPKTIHV